MRKIAPATAATETMPRRMRRKISSAFVVWPSAVMIGSRSCGGLGVGACSAPENSGRTLPAEVDGVSDPDKTASSASALVRRLFDLAMGQADAHRHGILD